MLYVFPKRVPFIIFGLLISIFPYLKVNSQETRKVEELLNGWNFINKDVSDGFKNNLNTSGWTEVKVPHDWAIAGPFSKENDPQKVRVTEDGESKEKIRIGRTGGLPYIGVGWYRKELNISLNDKGKAISIEFDGAMSNAKIYLNERFVGEWPYGYASFSFDISKFINWGGKNILAVRLENFKGSARWYPGAGIYRHVRLVKKNPIYVDHWGTFITTPIISEQKAVINIQTKIKNDTGNPKEIEVFQIVYDSKGYKKGEISNFYNLKDSLNITHNLDVLKPKLWSAENPYNYSLKTIIKASGKVIDEYKSSFGIRKIEFKPDEGMLVNGIKTKLKGVCLHHDLGPLGAAFNKAALQHHLLLLKEMGCNAIRGTHNPHAPEMLELCDEMGFYYIDETFDEWRIPKVENGYHKIFDAWAKKDVEAMIKRDRNHPALIMYSIGNEIREANTPDGGKLAQYLADICRKTDPTRPVTAGFNHLEPAIKNGLAAAVDIPGWNYKPNYYADIHKRFPNWVIYGSETASTVSSRGVYQLPAKMASMKIWPDNQASSYDLEYCSWSQIPDIEWKSQEENDFVAGEFVWTGVDYLGEPSPFNDNWPSRSSYFGIIDLSGIPKDRYYLYKSQWSKEKVLHLLPHWNWKGKEGEQIPVFAYTNYAAAELFVNGKSYGKKTFDKNSLLDRYRLRWENVVYEAGEIKVVAFDESNKIRETKIIKTAGEPFKIVLNADRNNLKADEKDLAYVTVSVVDKDGNVCPLADNLISFNVKGNGFLRAVGNGNPSTTEPFQANYRKAFYGKCMAIIQNNGKAGSIEIEATSSNLTSDKLKIKIK
ncbi:beta-galactosidase GalB [Pedobacter glucosidilyticus]|uniref:beta-galactosidase GalB n=1 Tax=Pedobacter glucosidilyticus TaxID=1122941 RepID=UPI0026EECE18|nr:beta-galactosidase GalB [Pedobacter glucosidilyticus]